MTSRPTRPRTVVPPPPPVRSELPKWRGIYQTLNPSSSSAASPHRSNAVAAVLSNTPSPTRPPRPSAARAPDAAPHIPGGFDCCPTMKELRDEANRIPRDTTGRENYPPWTCPKCKTVNEQIVCLLATLPPLECKNCPEQNDVPFDFNINRVKLNSIDISPPVLDQGTQGKCSMYATLACANGYQRIEGAKAGISDFQQLCQESLQDEYAVVAGCRYKKEGVGHRGEQRSKRMFQALKAGVLFKTNFLNGSARGRFKAKKIWTVSKTKFNHICMLIANGHPMVSSIVGGKNLGTYKPNSVYKAPSVAKAEQRVGGYVSHAVMLCGGGAQPRVSGKKCKRHLWIRNSFSERWGIKGDGKIRESDLIGDPIGMTL